MDLKTIRCKIKTGTYECVEDMISDVDLLFSNCQLYHRRHSDIGKAGVALKRYFERRCSDLGLRDCALLTVNAGTPKLRSSRRNK